MFMNWMLHHYYYDLMDEGYLIGPVQHAQIDSENAWKLIGALFFKSRNKMPL